jgi:hypothetical protein
MTGSNTTPKKRGRKPKLEADNRKTTVSKRMIKGAVRGVLTPEEIFKIQVQDRSNAVNHPNHYGGELNPYEAIKVIEAWNLGFNIGNTVKYLSRAGKKDGNPPLQDLEKACWYLSREIQNLKKQNS